MSKDYRGREAAVETLGRLGDPKAFDTLLSLVEDPKLQLSASKALIDMSPDPRVTEPALKLAKSSDWQIRQRAAMLLGRSGDPKVLPALTDLLKDPDLTVRGYAARALGKLGSKDGAEALAGALRDRKLFVQLCAIEGLIALKDQRVMDSSIKIMNDANIVTRIKLIELLSRAGTAEAAAVIAPQLAAEEDYLRQAAEDGLRKIGDPAIVPVGEFMIKFPNSNRNWPIAGAVAKFMASFGQPAIPVLVACVASDNWQASIRSSEQIAQFGETAAVPLISELESNKDNPQRVERIVSALGLTNCPKAAEALASQLDNKSSKIQDKALEGLKKITGQDFGKDAKKWQEWLKKQAEETR